MNLCMSLSRCSCVRLIKIHVSTGSLLCPVTYDVASNCHVAHVSHAQPKKSVAIVSFVKQKSFLGNILQAAALVQLGHAAQFTYRATTTIISLSFKNFYKAGWDLQEILA